MFERFTDQARKVMQLANRHAQRMNLEYVGTEHILLGLIEEGWGLAAVVLKNFGVDLGRTRLEVEKLVKSGPEMVTIGKLPQTPSAKKVIEYAMEEARNLNHNYIGTEHILLGLLRENEGVAAQVLMNLGVKIGDVRAEVLNVLGHGPEIKKEFQKDSAPDANTVLEELLVAAGKKREDLPALLRGLDNKESDIRAFITFVLKLSVFKESEIKKENSASVSEQK